MQKWGSSDLGNWVNMLFQSLQGQAKQHRGAPKKDSSTKMVSKVAVGEAAGVRFYLTLNNTPELIKLKLLFLTRITPKLSLQVVPEVLLTQS